MNIKPIPIRTAVLAGLLCAAVATAGIVSAVPANAADAFVPVTTVTGVTIKTTVKSTQVVDIAGGSTKSGAKVQEYKSNNTAAQHFSIKCDAAGWCQIVNDKSKMCLDVYGGKAKSKARIVQHPCTAASSQQWLLRANAGGTTTFLSKLNTGYAMDVYKARTKNKTPIQLYKSNGTKAQKFVLAGGTVVNPTPTPTPTPKAAASIIDTQCRQWHVDGPFYFVIDVIDNDLAGWTLIVDDNGNTISRTNVGSLGYSFVSATPDCAGMSARLA